MSEILVKTAQRNYRINVGKKNSVDLNKRLLKHNKNGRIHLFYDANFYALHGQKLSRSIKRSKRSLTEMVIPSGEKYKREYLLATVYDFLLSEQISRDDLIVACGGGVTTDVVGYAASTILRGVQWGAVPTTLLGMVDASIGGKTGINHRRGKNLIGTFWQPTFVHTDLIYLATLPEREFMAGMGEVLKYAGLAGPKISKPLDAYFSQRKTYNWKLLSDLVELSARYKAKIVALDEREAGVRMWLNYGHTVGHAIEKTLGYGKLLHGEAVILGIVAALELGKVIGLRQTSALEVYHSLAISMLELVPKKKLKIDAILDAITLDKKRSGADLKYVLLERPGKPFVADKMDRGAIEQAVNQMLEMY